MEENLNRNTPDNLDDLAPKNVVPEEEKVHVESVRQPENEAPEKQPINQPEERKSSLKGYKTIGLKSILAWAKVVAVGGIISLGCIIAAIWLLVRNNLPEHSGLKFYHVFADKPWATILLFASILAMIAYVVIANKYAIQTLINLVWNNKLADFIIPKIQHYIQVLSDRQPGWMKGMTSSKFVSICLDIIRQDGTLNKVQRLVLGYGFKGLKLRNSDFQQPEYQLSHIVIGKIESKIAEITQPSLSLFWIVFIIQIAFLILAFVLK